MTFTYYTNGIKTIKIYSDRSDQIIPDGFYAGRTFKNNPWNKGLTKNTSEKVKMNTDACHRTRKNKNNYLSWNKGLTKEDNEILKSVSDKVSKANKGKQAWNFGVPRSDEQKRNQSEKMVGKIPWNKNLTKETDERINKMSEKMTGHPCFVTDWNSAKQKEYATKKKNGTTNSSKPEKSLVESFVAEFGKDDVITQYIDDRYPFPCDIYIRSLDLFVEYNGTIEHNGKPFDKNNPEHLKELEELKKKAIEKGDNSRYWNIIYWWTERDPLKLKFLRDNKLNFKIIYPNLTITS